MYETERLVPNLQAAGFLLILVYSVKRAIQIVDRGVGKTPA
jgi:hypothetical protein